MIGLEQWDQLKQGQAFEVQLVGRQALFVKMATDPFSSPIGNGGCCNVYTGNDHNITELIDITKPLLEQISLVTLESHRCSPSSATT